MYGAPRWKGAVGTHDFQVVAGVLGQGETGEGHFTFRDIWISSLNLHGIGHAEGNCPYRGAIGIAPPIGNKGIQRGRRGTRPGDLERGSHSSERGIRKNRCQINGIGTGLGLLQSAKLLIDARNIRLV